MATAPDRKIIKDFCEQSPSSGGNQIIREKAKLQLENIDTAEPDLDPEGNRIDRTDVGSLMESLTAGPSLEIVQPKIESKDDINDVSGVGSNPEQTEEKDQDNCAGDRLRFRIDSPTVFERARSSGENADEEKFQQIIRDRCRSAGKQMEDCRDKSDVKQMIVHMQTECRVSKDHQLDERKSHSASNRGLETTSSHKEEKDQIEQKSTKQDDEIKNALHLRVLSVNDTNEFYLNDSSKDSDFQELISGNVEDLETKRNEGRKNESAANINDIDATSSSKQVMNEVFQNTKKPFLQPNEVAFDNEASSKDQERVSSPASDLKPSDSKRGEFTRSNPKLEALNINNQIDTPGLGFPPKQKKQSKQNEVQSTTFFDLPKTMNQMNVQNGSAGEHKLKATSISNDRQSQTGSCKGWHENDSISSKQSLLLSHHPEQPSLRQNTPVISLTNSDKMIDQLEDLEVLLQCNPSSSNSQATLSVEDCRESELKCLEDLLRGSTPSRIKSNASSNEQATKKNDKVQTDTGQNAGLKRLEDLLHGSTPSRIKSKASTNDQVSNQNDKIEANRGQNPDLKYLEDLLLDPTPSIIQSTANLDIHVPNENDDKHPELQGLENLLDGSTPSRTQPNDSTPPRTQLNASSDDQASNKSNKIEAEKGQNHESKYLNDLLLDSTPSRNQSNANSDNRVWNKSAAIRSGTKIPSSLQSSNVESALPEKVVPRMNSTTGLPEHSYPSLPPNLSGYSAPIRDSTTILPDRYQSTENLEATTAVCQQNMEEFSEEGQLSVFSDATSGQDYMRHVSNAKKQLKRIEDEMNRLRGINDRGESVILDNNNSCGDNRSEMQPFEMHRASEKGIQSQITKKVMKPTEQKERGIEPPTRKQEIFDRSASSEEISRKVRRKTSKKEQVRPEKGTRKDSMDPVGKDTPRRKYSHREMERDVSPPSFKRRMERDNSPIPKNAVNTKQNPNRNDPPMMVRGSLEVEGSPTYWNGDHLSLGNKSKRKKKREKNRSKDGSESRNRGGQPKYKGHFQNEIETNMNSVVSSHMERGDEGWSIPIDEDADNMMPENNFIGEEEEIDKVPRQVDTKKSNHHQQRYDPWEEVPCSCCCRYLPHKLVVATTHAYRLDRADEKDHELMDFTL